MATKLTLTVEKNIIDQAKKYASRKGRSLSNLVENYLRTLVQKDPDPQEISPIVKKLAGSVRFPKEFDYKKELSKVLTEKHVK